MDFGINVRAQQQRHKKGSKQHDGATGISIMRMLRYLFIDSHAMRIPYGVQVAGPEGGVYLSPRHCNNAM